MAHADQRDDQSTLFEDGIEKASGRQSAEVGASPGKPQQLRVRWLERIEAFLGSLLVVAILALVVIQVAQRLLPGFGGWTWSGELARYSLVWLTFLCAGLLLAQDKHISLHLTDLVLPERAIGIVKAFANLVIAAIALTMMYEAFTLITRETTQTSPAAGIPMAWVYSIHLVGFTLTALRAVLGLFDIKQR